MSRLVAVKRTDRSGRTQTRWVRPERQASQGRPIPAPDEAILAALTAPGSEYLTLPSRPDGIMSLWAASPISTTNYTLEDFDASAVAEVERLLAECRESSTSGPAMVLQMSVSSALKLMADEGEPSEFHNLAAFGRFLYPAAPDVASHYINFLHEYTSREADYVLQATDGERERAAAMVSFIARADGVAGGQFVVFHEGDDETIRHTAPADPAIARYVWEHPQAADDVLGVLIQEGGPLPLEVVVERLAHQQPALRDGLL